MTDYSTQIYESWHSKQLEKYADVFPSIKTHLADDMTVLDFGVGPAWFQEFLRQQGLKFNRVVGVDPDTEMTKPQKPYIEYHESLNEVKEKFNFVIAFDSAHLSNANLMSYVKNNGFLFISVPFKFKEALNNFKGKILAQGEIGQQERDSFLFMQKI